MKSECLRISSRYFFNFPQVSSQPMKSECLRISSRYFFLIFRKFPRSQAKSSVSEFHQSFLNFSASFLAAKQNRVCQNFIKVFSTFRHVSSQPIKSECLKKFIKVFSFKFSARFLAANEKRVSQNFIKVFFNFSARFLAANQNRVSQNFIKVFF